MNGRFSRALRQVIKPPDRNRICGHFRYEGSQLRAPQARRLYQGAKRDRVRPRQSALLTSRIKKIRQQYAEEKWEPVGRGFLARRENVRTVITENMERLLALVRRGKVATMKQKKEIRVSKGKSHKASPAKKRARQLRQITQRRGR